MKTRSYKVGDRIFYKDADGKICTDIIIEIRDEYYINDKSKHIEYKLLITDKHDNWSMGIEDYNCLSPNNPLCKDIVKSYKEFDKNKDEIIGSITKILSKYDKIIQKDILKILETKTG